MTRLLSQADAAGLIDWEVSMDWGVFSGGVLIVSSPTCRALGFSWSSRTAANRR
jgi:hypothetical protein